MPARTPRRRFTVKNTLREVESRNVVARLEGSDPKLKNEYVVYTAHWDHLGRDRRSRATRSTTAPLDNASGVAPLLEIAEAFTKLPTPPKRSILFLAVTAEEKGLLGAKYYASTRSTRWRRRSPTSTWTAPTSGGARATSSVIGLGNSTLDDVLAEVATAAGPRRRARPRAREGLLLPLRPLRVRQAGRARPLRRRGHGLHRQARRLRQEEARRVHRATTTTSRQRRGEARLGPLGGAVEDVRLLFDVGLRVAAARPVPSGSRARSSRRGATSCGSDEGRRARDHTARQCSRAVLTPFRGAD